MILSDLSRDLRGVTPNWKPQCYSASRQFSVQTKPAESRTSLTAIFVHALHLLIPLSCYDPLKVPQNLWLALLVPIPGPEGCMYPSYSWLSLLDLALSAFPDLNPDQACLDLSLPAHNQGAGEGWGDGARGSVVWMLGGEEKDAEKVTLTMT